MRFAQIVNNRVMNPCDGPDVSAATAQAFAPAFISSEIAAHRYWIAVPDGVPANALLDGHGGWTAAPAPAIEANDPAPASVTVEDLAARVDDMSILLNKIADHFGIS